MVRPRGLMAKALDFGSPKSNSLEIPGSTPGVVDRTAVFPFCDLIYCFPFDVLHSRFCLRVKTRVVGDCLMKSTFPRSDCRTDYGKKHNACPSHSAHRDIFLHLLDL